MNEYPAKSAIVEDFAWAVAHKMVLCHFYMHANKGAARTVANTIVSHFGHPTREWDLRDLKWRRKYQIEFMDALMIGDMSATKILHCQTGKLKSSGREKRFIRRLVSGHSSNPLTFAVYCLACSYRNRRGMAHGCTRWHFAFHVLHNITLLRIIYDWSISCVVPENGSPE
jgi:hypothetical protein